MSLPVSSRWILIPTVILVSTLCGCGDDAGVPADAAADAPPADAPALLDAPIDAPPVDAAPPVFSDAGIYTTPVTMGQIQCGILLEQLCSLDTSTCCFNRSGADICPPINAGTDAGAGACLFDMTCDGPEDCPNGQSCCIRFAGASVVARCADTCAAPTTPGCHSATQCPSAELACCRLFIPAVSSPANFGVCLDPANVPALNMAQFQCDIR